MNGKILLTRNLLEHAVFQILLLVMVFLSFGTISAQAQDAATVSTDKDDYSPGQYVIVTGAGWVPGETVLFDFHETPKVCTSDHHERSTIAKADGTIYYDQFLINEKHLGVAFVLTATGQSSGMQAVTYFTDAGIKSVSVSSQSICAGEQLTVTFEAVSAGQGSFTNNNYFIAQLSNASGDFTSPINIGQMQGKHANNVNQTLIATIPNSIASGTGYRIRLVSTEVVVIGPDNGTNISISAKPTIASAGNDQLDAVGTSTTLAGNIPAVGTGTWTIISGEGGSFGANASTTSSNPTTTFNGAIGETYTLRWTISNGSCAASSDLVQIKFNQIPTSTSILNASATYGDPVVILSSSVSPNPGSGSVEFYVNNVKVGTGVVGGNGVATVEFNPSSLNASSASVRHTISAKYLGTSLYINSSSEDGTLTINKANQVINWASPQKIVYGTALSAAELNASLAKGDGSLSYVPAVGTILDAGENQILTVMAAETNNYNAASATVNLDVARATPTVSLSVGGPYTYDGSPKSVSSAIVTGVAGATLGNATVTYTRDGNPVGSPTNAGSYDVIASFGGNSNYESANATGTLVIAKAFASLNPGTQSYTYDGNAKSINITTTPANLSGVSITYRSGGVIVPAANVVNAGSYLYYAELNNENYESEPTSGTLIIAKAAMAIKADNATRTYGDNNPAFTGYVVSGAVQGESFNVTASSAALSSSNIGEYDIIPAVTGATISNYNVTATKGTLTITKRPITITPNAGQGKVYGSTDPALTYYNTALVGTDTFSGALSREPGSNVGAYKVTQGTLSLSNNYSIDFAEGVEFNITAKPLTASISAADKVYDGATTASATGSVPAADVVAGDIVSVMIGNANFDTKNVGAGKAVIANVSISNPNYSLTSSSAATTASITPAPLTITAPNLSKYCGQVDPMTGYSCHVDGAVNGEQFVTSYTIEGTTVKPVCSESAKLSNYEVTYVNGTLTINGLTLDASNASTPRSIHEDVVITVSVKDGETNVPGVSVKLLFDGSLKATATSDANGVATFNLGKLTVNVYAVTAEAGDACSVSQIAYLPVYDPEGGFVTGGGWINSPAGALDGSDVTGKANFGFVAKYKKGKNEVEGNTEFQFQAGNINFKSLAHNAGTLVISGSKATYKGTGTIAGQTGTYEFMVVATDGHVTGGGGYDKFRIKIWNGGQVVYDNARGALDNEELGDNTRLGGGSIVIHENKTLSASSGKKLESAEQLDGLSSARFDNYPNAFADRTIIRFAFDAEQNYALEVYDVRGALVKKVSAGVAEAGKVYEFELDGRNLAEGVYFAKLATGSKTQTIKMLLKK